MLLVNLAHNDGMRLLTVFVACAAALLITWLFMRGATKYQHLIGTTGIHVVTRVLGIILAALAVQFVLNGLEQSHVLKH
jgi:multiple antibiotic resistance protein